MNEATPEDGRGPWLAGEVEGFSTFPDEALGRSVGERFAKIAAERPDHEALSSPAGRWTYSELLADVSGAAGAIRDLLEDVENEQGRTVVLLMDHDGPLVAAILAVVWSGDVVVVLDPTAPENQQVHALSESDARLLVHDGAHADMASALCAQSGAARVEWTDLTGDPVPVAPVGPDAPLMLAFTSGTSGEPKAAVITHSVLLNVARGATNALGLTAEDRMPMLFPTSLAVAAYPLFLPLLNGGTLATLDVRSVGLEPIPDFLERERITLAYMAPTVIRFLVDVLEGRSFPDMRLVALGGELVDAEVMALTARLFEPTHIAVGYGTTESGVVSLHVQEAGAEVAGTVPCGWPVAEVEILVLDEDGQRVEGDEAGEIAIVSPHMFRGYKGHPELNRLVLSADPEGRDGWSLYRTGDFGRIDTTGELVVSGRIDTKVKIRGRMVVLGDVEADLNGIEGVQAAAVTTHRVGGVNELVAHVVVAPGVDLTTTDVRAALLSHREPYRVPGSVVVLDELPTLPNGKTDRRALPAPEAAARTAAPVRTAVPGGAGRPPASDAGELQDACRAIRDLWERLLPVGVVGVDEDFFELGGDSLLAAQMLVMLDQELDVTVPMGELIHARTVEQLAEVVVGLRPEDPRELATTSLVQVGDARRAPLWFVPDLQGSAYRVRHLAAAIGADQPVWSFESPLLNGYRNPYDSLEDLAGRFVTDMRSTQPSGPYLLGGYSFGGICAYEMARQLVRAGEEVGFVGVVDVGPGYRGPGWHSRSPFRPWFGVPKPPEEGLGPAAVAQHYRSMFRDSPRGALRHLMVRSGIASRVDPIRFEADLRRSGRVRPEWRLWYAWEQHWKLAAKAWNRSNPYRGRVDLFWASDSPSADATMGWGPLVGDLRIHRFDGDHFGVLEPRGAGSLGKAIRRVLDDD